MIDDIESKGYGLPYLGIKPSAVGVVPVAPVPMPQMPMTNPVIPTPAAPSTPTTMPTQRTKLPSSKNPANVASPMPLSQPQAPSVPEPLKTTQAPISNAQLYQPPMRLSSSASPTPQIAGPAQPQLFKPLFSQVPMGGLQNGDKPEEENVPLPMSLTPKPAQMPQQTPSFNQLNTLLNRRNMK